MPRIVRYLTHPYLLLTLTTLFWAGNSIAGKVLADLISPMALVFIRWFFTGAVMLILNWRAIKKYQKEMRQHWKIITLLSFLGFICFNSLFYIAAQFTQAINIGILQGFIPAIVIIVGSLFFGQSFKFIQFFGVCIAIFGVFIVMTAGQLALLFSIQFNFGDILMLIACISYALYTLFLKRRPSNIESLALFTFLSLYGCILSLPGFFYEVITERFFLNFQEAVWWILYITIFPSCIAQLLYLLSVDKIGSTKASVFINLVPIFSALLSVIILDEDFLFYHLLSLIFIIMGIYLAQQKKWIR